MPKLLSATVCCVHCLELASFEDGLASSSATTAGAASAGAAVSAAGGAAVVNNDGNDDDGDDDDDNNDDYLNEVPRESGEDMAAGPSTSAGLNKGQ